MVVVKKPSCVSAQVTSLITSIVRGSKNVTDVGTELSYILPSNSSQSFPQLFDTLEGEHVLSVNHIYNVCVILGTVTECVWVHIILCNFHVSYCGTHV